MKAHRAIKRGAKSGPFATLCRMDNRAFCPFAAMLHAPLFIDVASTALTADDCRRIAHPLTGGVILFTRNWQSRAQITALAAAIKAIRGDVVIAIDHEGGRVQRFREGGFTRLPAMRALGRLFDAEPMQALAAATACGYVLAAELRACGIDLSFAPVLDLDWGQSAVIGDRALHAQPQAVAQLAKSLLHGLLLAGMKGCGKHFPGHGHTPDDSHTHLPQDERALAALLQADAAPYGWLGAALPAVMPAHVIYPQVDERPAGFSAYWLQDVLRGLLDFQGAIISDDLGMAAARQLQGRQLGYAQAACAALSAGCDMALLCNQSANGGAALDAALDELQAAQGTHWQPNPASEARRRALLPASAAPAWDELMAQPVYQQALAMVEKLMAFEKNV